MAKKRAYHFISIKSVIFIGFVDLLGWDFTSEEGLSQLPKLLPFLSIPIHPFIALILSYDLSISYDKQASLMLFRPLPQHLL